MNKRRMALLTKPNKSLLIKERKWLRLCLMMGVNILEGCKMISRMVWGRSIWLVVNIIRGNIVLESRRVRVSVGSPIPRDMRDSFDKI